MLESEHVNDEIIKNLRTTNAWLQHKNRRSFTFTTQKIIRNSAGFRKQAPPSAGYTCQYYPALSTILTALDPQTALVLIDLQKGIVTGEKAHPTEIIIHQATRLKEAFRRAKLLVIVVHVEPIGAPASVVRSEKGNFPKDANGQKQALEKMQSNGFFDIVDPIKPDSDDIQITKETWNAFYNTPLHDELQKRRITGIVLAGISTSVGVEGTARSANERGYNITFATDAMTDTIAAAHDNSITYIFPRIGELATTDAILAHLADKA